MDGVVGPGLMTNTVYAVDACRTPIGKIKGALAETRAHGLRRDYLIRQIELKLEQLDRHAAQVKELRGRLICAAGELKARMKNGVTCHTRPSPPSALRTNKPRSAPRAHRRSLTTTG